MTFADLFASPDDPDLNFCYLQQKIDEGDIKAAIPVVERMLLLDPYQPRTRILYASLLYHTDMMADARREFEEVRTRELPQSDDMLVLDYLKRIDELNERNSHYLSFTVTGHNDNNRNNAPDGDTILFYGYEYDYRIPYESDYGTETSVSYDFERSYGSYLQHALLASLTYQRDNQAKFDQQDYSTWQGSVGTRLTAGKTDITTTVSAAYQRLAGDGLLRSHGGRIRADYPIDWRDAGIRLDLAASAGVTAENYVSDLSSDSSGKRYSSRVSASFTFGTAHNLYTSLGYTDKSARDDSLAYTSWNTSLSYRWTHLSGHSLSTYISRGKTLYSGTPLYVTGNTDIKRHDIPVFASAAWRMPLTIADDFYLTISGERQITRSDIPNYQSRNIRWLASLTKSFSF